MKPTLHTIDQRYPPNSDRPTECSASTGLERTHRTQTAWRWSGFVEARVPTGEPKPNRAAFWRSLGGGIVGTIVCNVMSRHKACYNM